MPSCNAWPLELKGAAAAVLALISGFHLLAADPGPRAASRQLDQAGRQVHLLQQQGAIQPANSCGCLPAISAHAECYCAADPGSGAADRHRNQDGWQARLLKGQDAFQPGRVVVSPSRVLLSCSLASCAADPGSRAAGRQRDQAGRQVRLLQQQGALQPANCRRREAGAGGRRGQVCAGVQAALHRAE